MTLNQLATAEPSRVSAPARLWNPKAVLLIAGVAFGAALYALTRPLHDFVEYWTAAQLLIAHQNPYSIADVARMEHALGFEQLVPIMLLSPPMILPLIAPIGLFNSYWLACLVWIVVLIAAVALSSRLLMDIYFGDLRLKDISDTGFYRCLFAFTFFPVLLCLRFTQTAPLMLLGVAGFLYFEKKHRHVLAGALLSLTLIKPHLLFLVWLAMIFCSWQRRTWKILIAAVGSCATLTAIALLLDPHALRHYWELTSGPYLQAYASGVAGLPRKLAGGVGTLWIQLVPPILGLIWFAFYWRRNRDSWSWTEQMPMLLTVSVLTSAYGWHFDQTLLSLPVIALAGKQARATGRISAKAVIAYTALNATLMLTWPLPTIALLPAPIFLAVLLKRESRSREAMVAAQV